MSFVDKIEGDDSDVGVKSLHTEALAEEANIGWLNLAGGSRWHSPNAKALPSGHGNLNRNVVREAKPRIRAQHRASGVRRHGQRRRSVSCNLCLRITAMDRSCVIVMNTFFIAL